MQHYLNIRFDCSSEDDRLRISEPHGSPTPATGCIQRSGYVLTPGLHRCNELPPTVGRKPYSFFTVSAGFNRDALTVK